MPFDRLINEDEEYFAHDDRFSFYKHIITYKVEDNYETWMGMAKEY